MNNKQMITSIIALLMIGNYSIATGINANNGGRTDSLAKKNDSAAIILSERYERLVKKELVVVKRLLKTIDSLGFDQNALLYFGRDNLIDRFNSHKRRIHSLKAVTKEEWIVLGKMNEEMSIILSAIRAYRVIAALRSKQVQRITYEDIKNIETPVRKRIDNGDTIFQNSVDLYYAFTTVTGIARNPNDSLLFRDKFKKSKPLLIMSMYLLDFDEDNTNGQPIKLLAGMDDEEFDLCMKWNYYFKSTVEPLIIRVAGEYEDGLRKAEDVSDSSLVRKFYTKYSKDDLRRILAKLKQYDKCGETDLFKNCDIIEEIYSIKHKPN